MPEAEEIDVQINPNDLQVDTIILKVPVGKTLIKPSLQSASLIFNWNSCGMPNRKSQIQNREIAMQMLRAKIYANMLAEQQEKLATKEN